MDISWEDAQTFLAVADARSMSGAARALGLGQPTISRRIAGLEARLGCQLFRRGKRGAELTDDGARLLPAAEQMARWAAEFDRLARGAEASVSGVVRIAAPPALSVDFLGPFAAALRERSPALRLEVLSSIEHVDLGRGTADLAVRTRPPHEPELVRLARLTVPLAVYGARGYVRRLAGRPVALADLDWITWAFPFDHVPPRPMLERAIPGFTPAFASDDYLVQRSALVAGVGAMILERPLPLAGGFAGATELEEIDVGITLPPGELHLVCARSIRAVPRVQAVVEALMAELARLGVDASPDPDAPPPATGGGSGPARLRSGA